MASTGWKGICSGPWSEGPQGRVTRQGICGTIRPWPMSRLRGWAADPPDWRYQGRTCATPAPVPASTASAIQGRRRQSRQQPRHQAVRPTKGYILMATANQANPAAGRAAQRAARQLTAASPASSRKMTESMLARSSANCMGNPSRITASRPLANHSGFTSRRLSSARIVITARPKQKPSSPVW